MDIFDEIIDKAKAAFDVAIKVTEDVVDNGKQKFNLSSLENKIAKDYKALGKAFYNFKKEGEIDNEAIEELITSIDEKKAKIEEIKQEISKAKSERICANCGAAIENDIIFCPLCGQKLEFSTDDE